MASVGMTIDPREPRGRPAARNLAQVSVWKLFRQKKSVVEEASEESAGQGADPVDALICKVSASGEPGADSASGIQSAAGEGHGHENAERVRAADGDGGFCAGGVAIIAGGGEKNKNDEERGQSFQGHAGPL